MRFYAGLAALVAAVFAFSIIGAFLYIHDPAPSAQRLAGEYVKALAANSGVSIIGDKVWSVRHVGDTTVVIVRIKFRVPQRCDFFGCTPPSVQWVTAYVREFDGQLLP